jgi:hypothetical protein
MATLITSGPVNEKISTATPSGSSYEEYSNSRQEVPFDQNAEHDFTEGKKAFKKSVIEHLSKSSPQIKIGEYFLFKISELKKLIESSPEADHVRFHNSIDEQHYHKLYAIPVNSKSENKNKEINDKKSIAIEAMPCPPDPRCPH